MFSLLLLSAPINIRYAPFFDLYQRQTDREMPTLSQEAIWDITMEGLCSDLLSTLEVEEEYAIQRHCFLDHLAFIHDTLDHIGYSVWEATDSVSLVLDALFRQLQRYGAYDVNGHLDFPYLWVDMPDTVALSKHVVYYPRTTGPAPYVTAGIPHHRYLSLDPALSRTATASGGVYRPRPLGTTSRDDGSLQRAAHRVVLRRPSAIHGTTMVRGAASPDPPHLRHALHDVQRSTETAAGSEPTLLLEGAAPESRSGTGVV